MQYFRVKPARIVVIQKRRINLLTFHLFSFLKMQPSREADDDDDDYDEDDIEIDDEEESWVNLIFFFEKKSI